MFFGFWKSKISCQELADMLGPSFIKQTVAMFEEEKETLGEQSWVIAAARRNSHANLLQEWILFMLAAYINGCRSSMKPTPTHFEFARRFIFACVRDCVECGAFPAQSALQQAVQDRTSEYWEVFSGKDIDKAMHEVAQRFLRNVGCEPDDCAFRMLAAGQFVSVSAATKKLFDQLQKSYRIITAPE